MIQPALTPPGSYEKACNTFAEGALRLYASNPEEYGLGYLVGAINQPIFTPRYQASSLTMGCPCRVYAAEVSQSATEAYLQTEWGSELFELDIGWLALLAHPYQVQAQVERSSNEECEGVPVASFATTREALAKADRSSGESQAHTDSEIAALQQEIQVLDSSLRQLQQEKSLLADCLQAEAARALEFSQHFKSLDKRRQSLENELKALKQSGNHAEVQRQNAMALLREELGQAQRTIDELRQSSQQLSEVLLQTQTKFEARQEQLSQALVAQKRHAKEEQSRLDGVIEDLKTQLETTHAEVGLQREKGEQLEAQLEQKHQEAEYLKRLLAASKETLIITEKRFAEVERVQQEQLTKLEQKVEQQSIEKAQLFEQLQQELKAGQEAWRQASESDATTQVVKQELALLKGNLEQENSNLRAQLERLEKNSKANLHQYIEKTKSLQKSLAESQSKVKMAEATIRLQKRNLLLLQKAKLELQGQLEMREKQAQVRLEEPGVTIEASQRRVESLPQKPDAVNVRKQDPEAMDSLRKALQQAEDEKASLKRKIDGLREVQREMGNPLSEGMNTENTVLRNALKAAEAKLKIKYGELVRQANALLSESQVQETAI